MGAVADGIPDCLRDKKPVGQQGDPSVVPLSPDSRLGRLASPVLQGRDAMERYVGIDVSKRALDVHVLPEGEALHVPRDSKGLDELVSWLRARQPRIIAVEATGGFERVVAVELDAAGFEFGDGQQIVHEPLELSAK